MQSCANGFRFAAALTAPPPSPPPSEANAAPSQQQPHGLFSRVDSTLACYAVGLAASFGISHVDLIHNNLSRYFPKTYPTLNVILPCGRALFGLGILARAAELAEAPRNG